MGGLGQLQHSEASPVPSFFTFTENTFVWILLAILAGHVKGWDDRSCFAAPSFSLIGTWSCLVLWNVMQWVAVQSNPGEPFLLSCPHDSNYWRMTQKCMLSSCRLACKHLKHEWEISFQTRSWERTCNLNYIWTRHKGALLIDYASVLISHVRCDNSVYQKMFSIFLFVIKYYVFNVQSMSLREKLV